MDASRANEVNRGINTCQRVPAPRFPVADQSWSPEGAARSPGAVDILFVNPPGPDRGVWIRSQHRVGRRSREGMIWPQVGLAQMAALFPDYAVDVVDAIAHRMDWPTFEALLREKQPRYYVTQATAPTLQADMYGAFLARSLGAVTIAFGTHVTPMPTATMEAFPALDYVIRGEPELTLRELVDTLERRLAPDGEEDGPATQAQWWEWRPAMASGFAEQLGRLFAEADPAWRAAWLAPTPPPDRLAHVAGLVWRRNGVVTLNPDRPLIRDLDQLPLPRHDLLPLDKYRAPLIGGPYAFVVTSRGCPAGCRFCIKHVSYGTSVRFRSPESILREIDQLVGLGVKAVNMYADLFTVNRDHVMGICDGINERGLKLRWTCNSRVDFVDRELLQAMARSGCWTIAWGLESGDDRMLKRMAKGITTERAAQALLWAREAGIKNWGYFIIGLPGETEQSIRRTIGFAKELPLDLVLFHIAAPHPGTPFYFEVVENGWLRPGTRWEDVDMDRSTVLDYPDLRAEDLERWASRAFREWALRPGPMWTYLKMLVRSPSLLRPTLEIGREALRWAWSRS